MCKIVIGHLAKYNICQIISFVKCKAPGATNSWSFPTHISARANTHVLNKHIVSQLWRKIQGYFYALSKKGEFLCLRNVKMGGTPSR